MREKILAIVLDIRRHNEKLNVVTLYTDLHGRLAFLSPVSVGKSGKLRQARLQPLALIETEFLYNRSKELHRLGSFSLAAVWDNIYFHPLKRLTAIFISEFLSRILRATMPDPSLWKFLVDALHRLNDITDGTADFHIIFLCEMLSHAGITPETETSDSPLYFDMREGRFSSDPPMHHDVLSGDDAVFMRMAPDLNFDHAGHLNFDRSSRRRITAFLLDYYAIHFPGISGMKSPEMLREILS